MLILFNLVLGVDELLLGGEEVIFGGDVELVELLVLVLGDSA